MARRKKTAKDMTDEELKQRLFPKKVRDELERLAHEKDDETEAEQPSRNK